MQSLSILVVLTILGIAIAQQNPMMCSFCVTIVGNAQDSFGPTIVNATDLELLRYFREECPRCAIKSAMMAAECEYLVSYHPLMLFRDLREQKEALEIHLDYSQELAVMETIFLPILLLLFAGSLAVQKAHLDGPYCHMCEVILNDVRGDFNYNFTNVTPQQLLDKLYYECDQNLAGPACMQCHRIARNNLVLIYNDLQAGKGAYFICQQLQMC
ncbi:unnamed protein product [Cylicocyclus nassatus]|uniref:Saposin B-type domain-containing protein n=1 Tax=Cylicocyclus nassatus TaxID=53992 RepID=A0AA36GQ38_CYLNA|nr:unnamed protein product [Cylicocyclus nassatus]